MSKKLILICEDCLSRNYSYHKSELPRIKKLIIKKFCPKCNKRTVHSETL